MVVWLNGAFGEGKTTVARGLRCMWPGATIVDPERVGFLLRRVVPRFRRTGDFQDLSSWRDGPSDGS